MNRIEYFFFIRFKEGCSNLHLLFFLLIRSLSNFQVDFALDLYSHNFFIVVKTFSNAKGMCQFVFITLVKVLTV